VEGISALALLGWVGLPPVPLLRLLLCAAWLRVTWWAGPPSASEDVWRYLWDGALGWRGEPIYAHAPASHALDAAARAPELAALRPLIGHPEVPTIYPPGAQLAFRAATFDAWGLWPQVSLTRWRALTLTAELALVAGLWRWLEARALPTRYAALYALSPLMAFDSAHGAHLDCLGAALGVWGLASLERGRDLRAGALMAAGGWVKLAPWLWLLLAVAPEARALGRRRLTRLTLGAALAAALCLTPVALELWREGEGALGGLKTYGARWSFNGSLFALLHAPLEARWGDPYAHSLSQRLLGVVFLALCVHLSHASPGEGGRALRVGGGTFGLLLISPVVFSWYLTWGLALCPALLATSARRGDWGERWAWGIGVTLLAWSLLAPLTYLPRLALLTEGQWRVELWWRVCEYGALALTLARTTRYTPPNLSSAESPRRH
jgi:hypothetical protein